MSTDPREALLEAATSAFRERDSAGVILPAPAWLDLSPADRDVLFEHQVAARRLEALVHERGLSTTGRAVLARARALRQLEP